MDNSHIAENTATRERLKALVTRLSDADLLRPLGEGWSVAATFAHIAFWDQRALRLLEKWEREGVKPSPLPADVDAINDAAQALCLAIPPRAAAQLMVDTAEALDRKIEQIAPELAAAIQAAGGHVSFKRWHHRREHLEQLEQMFGG